jgi:hypothetical protein
MHAQAAPSLIRLDRLPANAQHTLELFSGADANSTEHPVADGRLKTLYSERRPVREIVVSELSRRPLVAYQKACVPNSTAAHMGRETFTLGGTLAEVTTRPVGWLPDDRLVVLAYDEPFLSVTLTPVPSHSRKERLAYL